MATSREQGRQEAECLKCNPTDLHEVGPEQRKLLLCLRHQHFLDFLNSSELSKHLKMVYSADYQPMINSILTWDSSKKMAGDKEVKLNL